MKRPRDHELGPGRRVVPAYALVGGRTHSVGADLPIEAMVATTPEGLRSLTSLRFEQREIALLCRRTPQSIAEVAARVKVPLGVARVLVSDLTAAGHLALHVPSTERPDRAILERLLSGLRAR
ncbi:MAG: DUF742 domain-containing protein [Acidimicrobiia bacterium]|nr:DUF742 domain-containing protein [Acidimicrobiia bacterium]